MCRLSRNLGASNSWKPLSLSRPGIASVNLRTNIDNLLKQRQLVGVCNEDGVCLLWRRKQCLNVIYTNLMLRRIRCLNKRNCFSLNVFVLLDYDFGRLTEATGLVTTLQRAAGSLASHCTGLEALPQGWSKLLDVRVTSRQVMFVCLLKGKTTRTAVLRALCQCRVITWLLWNGIMYLCMALRRMWETAVKFRLFWPWHCNDVRKR